MSHPVWVRGLKPANNTNNAYMTGVAPRVGAWIETTIARRTSIAFASHPVWVRGLKPLQSIRRTNLGRSHPVWVRGLKL